MTIKNKIKQLIESSPFAQEALSVVPPVLAFWGLLALISAAPIIGICAYVAVAVWISHKMYPLWGSNKEK